MSKTHHTHTDKSSQQPSLSKYYLLALAYNALIIPLSKFFSTDLGDVDPIFSPAGCFVILLWGCAYASVYKVYMHTPLTLVVFVAVKLMYGIRWVLWVRENYDGLLMELLRDDTVTGLFFSIYGLGDLIFAGFFAYSAYRYWDSDLVNAKKGK